MTDLISRADAIEAMCSKCLDRETCTRIVGTCDSAIAVAELPSAELPKGDLISRADAICEVLVNDGIDNIVDRIKALPSAKYITEKPNDAIKTDDEVIDLLLL